MEKKYVSPEMICLQFQTVDVITSSGNLSDLNLVGNEEKENDILNWLI